MRRRRRSDGKVRSLQTLLVFEALDDGFDLLDVLDTVPEQAPSSPGKATVGSLKVPGPVLVVGTGRPEQLPVILLDGLEDVIDDVVEDAVPAGKELRHDGNLAFGVGHDGDNIEGLVAVDGVWGLFEVVENTSDGLVAGDDVRIAVVDDLAQTIWANGVDGRMFEKLVSSADECSGTTVSEQLLL